MKTGARQKRESLRVFLLASSFQLLALAMASGCVKRALVIESDPPGATVWINEHLVGSSPVEYEFITHGRYKFRLKKEGFEEVVAREKVQAPIYQWIPLDFVAEYLVPFHFDDRHVFKYTLTPTLPEVQLRAITPEVLEKAAEDLQHPEERRRRQALVLLAAAGDSAYAEDVLGALEDSQPLVRAAALIAWRSLRGPAAMEQLVDRLRYDPSPEVRWQAALELEALGNPKAVPDLLVALADSSALVRTGAAEALKGIPDPRSVQPLIRALRDRDTAVRRAATEGLGRIGEPAAVGPLTRVLFHRDVQTRRRAVEALRLLKDPACGLALVRTFTDWDPQIRQVATEALIEFGDDRVVPKLIRYLRAVKPWTRAHAATVLGGLAAAQARGPLEKALARESVQEPRVAMKQALEAIETASDQ